QVPGASARSWIQVARPAHELTTARARAGSVRVLTAVELEKQAHEADEAEGDPETDHPPPDRQAEETERRGETENERPPAVRGEHTDLTGAFGDVSRRVVLRARIDPPGGDPEIPARQGRETTEQEQRDRSHRLPVGDDPVDHPDRDEEDD